MIGSIFKWSLVTAACIGGVIYLLDKNRERIIQILKPADVGDKDVKCVEQDVAFFPKDSFIRNVERFTGTFEPLYNAIYNSDVSLEDKTNVYEDWNLRLKTICDDTAYTKWTKKMSLLQIPDRLKLLLQEIVSCGVLRDNRTDLVIDENTVSRYIDWNSTPLAVGDEVKIASAAWLLNGVCIEKGVVTKKII